MSERTHERNLELIDRLSDDDLIDFATTCSNRGVALAADMHLRARYPSTRKTNRRATVVRQAQEPPAQ